jgi:hypothetical protein
MLLNNWWYKFPNQLTIFNERQKIVLIYALDKDSLVEYKIHFPKIKELFDQKESLTPLKIQQKEDPTLTMVKEIFSKEIEEE